MDVDESRTHHLSQMVFLKKVLIPDYRGLSVEKVCFTFFCPFLPEMGLAIFPIFCMIVEDNESYHLSYISVLKKKYPGL